MILALHYAEPHYGVVNAAQRLVVPTVTTLLHQGRHVHKLQRFEEHIEEGFVGKLFRGVHGSSESMAMAWIHEPPEPVAWNRMLGTCVFRRILGKPLDDARHIRLEGPGDEKLRTPARTPPRFSKSCVTPPGTR